MPKRVTWKSVHGNNPNQCILNSDSHQCEWIKTTDNQRCQNRSALFGLDMTAYNHIWFPYSRGQINRYNQNIPENRKQGRQYFCWIHAQKITGLRIVTQNGLRGLVFLPENPTSTIPNNMGLAAFSMEDRITEVEGSQRYGDDDTGAYLYAMEGETRLVDGMCHRDFGDYSNDIRLDVSRDRKPVCGTSVGIRGDTCWNSTAVERGRGGNARRNARLVTWEIPKNNNILVLQTSRMIRSGDTILWDYGSRFWSGYYCPRDGNLENPCNSVRERYARGRGGGRRGRGRGRRGRG